MNRAIDPASFSNLIVFPALTAIGLYSQAAEELVTGTALQESGLLFMHQVKGPALGFFQMEPATHDDIWSNYLAYNAELKAAVTALFAKVSFAGPGGLAGDPLYQLIGNAYYAAAMCRVLYERVPEPLPAPGDLAGQAAYYKLHYNTPAGAAKEADYIANWRAAFPNGLAPPTPSSPTPSQGAST